MIVKQLFRIFTTQQMLQQLYRFFERGDLFMDISQLSYFLQVAAMEHMSRAAAELNISQPALSSNIKKLEAELGVELFSRNGRHLELNRYGSFLYEQLCPIMGQLEDIFSTVREMQYADFNEIVVDAEPIYTFNGLLNHVYSVLSNYPGASLRNVRYSIKEIFRKIQANEIDFAIMGIDMNDPQINKLHLSSDELVMLVPKSHPYANAGSTRLINFAGDKFASKVKTGLPASYSLASESYCIQAGFVPNITFKSETRRDLVDAVRERQLVMFTPINTINQYRMDDMSIVHISDFDCRSDLWMYWKAGKKEKTITRLVRESVIDFFNERDSEQTEKESR